SSESCVWITGYALVHRDRSPQFFNKWKDSEKVPNRWLGKPLLRRPAEPWHASRGFDVDLANVARFRCLRHRDGEHAFCDLRRNRIAIDVNRKRKTALECSVGALAKVVIVILFFLLLPLFAFDEKHVVVDRDVDVFLFKARQLGGY